HLLETRGRMQGERPQVLDRVVRANRFAAVVTVRDRPVDGCRRIAAAGRRSPAVLSRSRPRIRANALQPAHDWRPASGAQCQSVAVGEMPSATSAGSVGCSRTNKVDGPEPGGGVTVEGLAPERGTLPVGR